MKAVYDINIRGIDGKNTNLHDFEGKKILNENVALTCGFTPQHVQLQELYNHYNKNLETVGVQCNDFGNLKPSS